MQGINQSINIETIIPEEILFQVCDNIGELSDLLNLREVTTLFNRVSSESSLYRKFADQVPNLDTLSKKNVSEQAGIFFNRYYEIMSRELGVENNASDPNSRKIIDQEIQKKLGEEYIQRGFQMNSLLQKLYEYIFNTEAENLETETIKMFLRSGVKPDIHVLNYCFLINDYKKTSVGVDVVKLIIKNLDTPLTTEQLQSLLGLATSTPNTGIEIFRFLIEELKCPLTNIFVNTDKFNEEIKAYIYAAQVAQEKQRREKLASDPEYQKLCLEEMNNFRGFGSANH